MTIPNPVESARFHAHLDKCAQCEQHPFDLCAEGVKLIEAAATDNSIVNAARRIAEKGEAK